MSIESMAIVLHHSRATATAKVVMLGIANHDGDGGAWPSVATLAQYANVTVRNVQKAIKSLEQAGEIRVYVQDGGTARTPDHTRPNRYEITLRCPHTCDGTSQHRTKRPLLGLNPHPLSETTPPVEIDTPPLSETTPEPSTNQTPIETSIYNDKYQHAREALDVSNEMKTKKLRPATAQPRSDTEQQLVDHYQTITCPSGAGLKHWLPPGTSECVRGCGLTLSSEQELEHAS